MKTLLLSVLMITWASASQAGTPSISCSWNPRLQRIVCVQQAPEIDTTSVVAGFTLFLGSLAVLRGRRVKGDKA